MKCGYFADASLHSTSFGFGLFAGAAKMILGYGCTILVRSDNSVIVHVGGTTLFMNSVVHFWEWWMSFSH